MSVLSVTVGSVKYSEFEGSVSCFIYDPTERKEYSLFAYAKGGNREGKIEGLTVVSGPRTDARVGIPRERGGSWSTMTLEARKSLLLKIQVRITGRTANKDATFYAMTRDGGAVNIANFTKVPVVDHGSLSRRNQEVLSGQFEQVDVDNVELLYSMKINPYYKSKARSSIIAGLIEFTEVKSAKKPPEEIVVKEVETNDGRKLKILRRSRSTARIIPPKKTKGDK